MKHEAQNTSRGWRDGAAAMASVLVALGCNVEETRRLPPTQLGMTDTVAPIYDDGELTLYEVKMPVPLPIHASTGPERQALRQRRVEPFDRYPFVTTEDVDVQVTWTVANLDRQAHNVRILLDPWNEFAKYWPGMQVVDADDGELAPNFSGIDIYRELPGLDDELDRESRIRGTFTFDDLREVAMDFAAVTNIIENAAPSAEALDAGEADPRVALTNHTFAVENRQGSSPLTDRYLPEVVPGITGFDIGLRTTEPANIAIEITVEIVDLGNDRVVAEDSDDEVMREPREFITLGM